MAQYSVHWTEPDAVRKVIVTGVNSEAEAAWFAALEHVTDVTNAKLTDVVRVNTHIE